MTAPAIEGIAELDPIGLDELVERAELLTRVDRKYVVTLREARELIGCRAGGHAGAGDRPPPRVRVPLGVPRHP